MAVIFFVLVLLITMPQIHIYNLFDSYHFRLFGWCWNRWPVEITTILLLTHTFTHLTHTFSYSSESSNTQHPFGNHEQSLSCPCLWYAAHTDFQICIALGISIALESHSKPRTFLLHTERTMLYSAPRLAKTAGRWTFMVIHCGPQLAEFKRGCERFCLPLNHWAAHELRFFLSDNTCPTAMTYQSHTKLWDADVYVTPHIHQRWKIMHKNLNLRTWIVLCRLSNY